MKTPKHFWLIFCSVIVSSVASQLYFYSTDPRLKTDPDGLIWGLVGIAAFVIVFGVVYALNIVLFEPIARFFRKRRERSNERKV